jgi:hypothetical protein
MTMISGERVRRAVLFEGPDRVPRDLPPPWGSDILTVGTSPDPNWQPSQPGQDEWGCTWAKLHGDKTHGQCVGHPLDDYAKLDDYQPPDYDNPARYEAAAAAIADGRGEKFVLAFLPISFIHRLEYLRGHAEAWTDPLEEPGRLHDLLTRLADVAIDSVRHMADLGAQGVFSCDDWGLQDRPMVSPDVFREHFAPHYKRVYDYARQRGMLCFLHSCGHIIDLIEPMIEAGVQVIQQDQQENMGVENLAARYGGRICFWCPVDIQHTMITGSLDDIRNYARKLIEQFGRYNGGFIAKHYPQPEAINHRPEATRAMCEAFVEYGG